MKTKRLFILCAYWIGAAIDAYAAINLLILRYWTSADSLSAASSATVNNLVFGVGQSAALMLGWTALLIWGAMKPIERRGVLLLTACPVMVASITNTVQGILAGAAPMEGALLTIVVQPVLLLLFISSYAIASKEKIKSNEHKDS